MKEKYLHDQLGYFKQSRELQLGLRLRQSWLLQRLRQLRLKDRLVRVVVGDGHSSTSGGGRVWLLGVWYDDYLSGMPLELIDRDRTAWQIRAEENAPLGCVLAAQPGACLYLYTKDDNLRLDFQVGQDCGQITVRTHFGQRSIDLSALQPGTLSVYPHRQEISVIREQAGGDEPLPEASPMTAPALLQPQGVFSRSDQEWLASQQLTPRPLSINHPEWRGILASARELFGNVYTIPDHLDSQQAAYFAALFKEAGCPSLTIQGFPLSYVHLVRAVRKLAPDLPIFAIYHGNYLHAREDYDWRSIQALKSLHDRGDIRRIGFVKQGMEEVLGAAGMRTAFVMNLVRQVPAAPSQPLSGERHIGIWSQPDYSWKKPPYAMLAAMALIKDAHAHVYNVSPRAQEYGALLRIPAEYRLEGVPAERIAAEMAGMHANLYITLTECAPMMPLESLAAGSPCLLGPTSHYFKDEPYLLSRLVVPEPDNAQMIARYACRVLEERDQVIQAYQQYAPGYNQRALAALADFLDPHRKNGSPV